MIFFCLSTAPPSALAGSEGRDNANDTTAPIGAIGGPAVSQTDNPVVNIFGWALDETVLINVGIYYSTLESSKANFLGNAVNVPDARPEAESAYPDYPGNQTAGWGYSVPTRLLPNGGNGTFIFRAVAKDQAGNQKILGFKEVTCDNTASAQPFGDIDTPQPGATISGQEYRVEGWALTPQPTSIPPNGVSVWVDGVKVEQATYNQPHPWVAQNFPGYANSDNAGWSITLQTAGHADGLHTLQVTYEDYLRNKSNAGPRYFTVMDDPASKARVGSGRGEAFDPAEAGVDPFQTPSQTVQVDDLGLLSLDLTGLFTGTGSYTYAGYHQVNGELRTLPVGSTLETQTGKYYWQPGPAFWGSYQLVFTRTDAGGQTEQVTVTAVVGEAS